MALKSCVSTSYRHLVESGALPMATLNNYFNLEEITTARKISAAVINISGRQRMLSQRTAFFCMRLVGSENAAEQTYWYILYVISQQAVTHNVASPQRYRLLGAEAENRAAGGVEGIVPPIEHSAKRNSV